MSGEMGNREKSTGRCNGNPICPWRLSLVLAYNPDHKNSLDFVSVPHAPMLSFAYLLPNSSIQQESHIINHV